MPLDTSAESPVPVRTVLQLVGGWISRLGRVWVEGQIAELAVRGGAVFLTLRDPVAAVSVRVICSRPVFDAAEPPPADGARVVILARPDFNANRGSFALTALEIRAVGVGQRHCHDPVADHLAANNIQVRLDLPVGGLSKGCCLVHFSRRAGPGSSCTG